MHAEVQVALHFFISFLYNKLPRRRVNQFGEELERALKVKFQGHWYPEKPCKGSAFRCLKTAPPLDPVFDRAAQESGMAMADIQENLPQELSIWIDPGEVSYRMGEKGVVKLLYSAAESAEERADREICRTFGLQEARGFRPIEAAVASLSLCSSSSSSPFGGSPSPKSSSSPFLPKVSHPVTFTTATFAQTKFGSTKLKTNGKRNHRMSPTEFSSYIKQRAIIQQQQQQMFAQQPRPRSLSPTPNAQQQLDNFLLLAHLNNNYPQQQQPSPTFSPSSQQRGCFDSGPNDVFPLSQQHATSKASSSSQQQLADNALSLFFDSKGPFGASAGGASGFRSAGASGADGKGYDGFGLSHPNQHLLMAN